MTVCAALLRRGIPVYRACTFVGEVDLVMKHAGRYLGVEVRSARKNKSGGTSYCSPKRDRYDVLALCFQDGSVKFQPALESFAA